MGVKKIKWQNKSWANISRSTVVQKMSAVRDWLFMAVLLWIKQLWLTIHVYDKYSPKRNWVPLWEYEKQWWYWFFKDQFINSSLWCHAIYQLNSWMVSHDIISMTTNFERKSNLFLLQLLKMNKNYTFVKTLQYQLHQLQHGYLSKCYEE